MKRSVIFELASSQSAAHIAAAYFEKRVQIWDVGSRQIVADHIKLAFIGGGANLAMSPDGKLLLTGRSNRSGRVSAYRTESGELIWERRGLEFPCGIRFGDHRTDHLWATVGWKKVTRLSTATGETQETVKDARSLFEGPRGERLIEPAARGTFRLSVGGHPQRGLPQTTDRVLCGTYSDECVFFGEARGPLRCIDLASGRERWRFAQPAGSHFRCLHYSQVDGFLYGTLDNYEEKRFRYLLRFDPATGKEMIVRDLVGCWAEVFVPALHQLVACSGLIVDLTTGKSVGELAFEQTEQEESR